MVRTKISCGDTRFIETVGREPINIKVGIIHEKPAVVEADAGHVPRRPVREAASDPPSHAEVQSATAAPRNRTLS